MFISHQSEKTKGVKGKKSEITDLTFTDMKNGNRKIPLVINELCGFTIFSIIFTRRHLPVMRTEGAEYVPNIIFPSFYLCDVDVKQKTLTCSACSQSLWWISDELSMFLGAKHISDAENQYDASGTAQTDSGITWCAVIISIRPLVLHGHVRSDRSGL